MKALGFPFFQHRTLAQVRRTEALLARAAAGSLLLNAEHCELLALITRARQNNPPPADEKAGAA